MFTPLTIVLIALTSSLQTTQATLANIPAQAVVQTTQEEQEIADVFPDAPIMQIAADCESGERDSNGKAISGTARQFNQNGTVIKNRNKDGTYDEGALQINSKHAKEAKVLGYDIKTLRGNLDYARILYDREGLRPWLSSFQCWGKGSAADDGSRARRSEVEAYETSRA